MLVASNLVSGPKIRNESDSEIRFVNNLEKDVAGAFVDPAGGNLHLRLRAREVVDRAVKLAEVTEDIDRQVRDGRPDIGADELSQ